MIDTNDRPPDEPRRPSRLEAEVAEILARTEEPASFTEHVRRKAQQRTPAPGSSPALPSLDQLGPGSFLLGALGFAVLGAMLNGVSPLLGTLCGLISIASLVMVWVRRTPPGTNRNKTWRGRTLQTGAETPPWVESLRDRLRRPPRI